MSLAAEALPASFKMGRAARRTTPGSGESVRCVKVGSRNRIELAAESCDPLIPQRFDSR